MKQSIKRDISFSGQFLRLLSRARPVTDQQSLRSARSSPNPRAQVDSAGPRPALSAGPTPPRPPGRSPVPVTEAGIYLGESASESERRPRPLWRETIIRAGRGGGYGSSSVSSVQGTCRAGGRPAEKTNRCFFFLLLLLPHRNTHKHPTGGPSYRGGIAAGPGTNPPVGGGVPPCGLVVSEQNADRKCSCRNDSLRRRQTLTTTPSSLLHFRHRRRRRRGRRCCCRCRRRHSGSRLCLSAPAPAGPEARRQRQRQWQRRSFPVPSSCSGRPWMLPVVSLLQGGVYAAAPVAGSVFFFFLEATALVRCDGVRPGSPSLRRSGPHRPQKAASRGRAALPDSRASLTRSPGEDELWWMPTVHLSNGVPVAVMDGSNVPPSPGSGRTLYLSVLFLRRTQSSEVKAPSLAELES
ncbi:uncharacterized protein LOC143435054 [Arvicanthis niloticus]|uniref:uncharacterized protein LOC143309408 n=1 Tax=Arvicanthis niloticus TaxID=61156 RepID=UPI00402B6E57